MRIAAIPPYPMLPESALPQALVDWRAEPARAALLIHDMQRYFLEPYQALRSPAAELVSNIGLLAARARALRMPVLYTAQPGGMTPDERGLLHDFWGAGMSKDPADTGIIDELAPEPGDAVLTKWRYSAFVHSDLERRLRAARRDQLIVCGVYAHVGCLMTACDAFSRDIETFFVSDAVADFTMEYHQLAIRYAADRCAVVTSTQRLLAALGMASPQSPCPEPGPGRAMPEDTRRPTQDSLRLMVAEILEIDVGEVTPEAAFYADLGMDSLQKSSVVVALEQRFGMTLVPEQAAAAQSVADLLRLSGG